MTTECNQFVFGFHPQKRREIRAQFDGGAITSDGGGLLLREVEKRVGMLRQFAACFTDYRNPELIEHQVAEMVAQRVYGLALGYEDLNDHEDLRNDPLLAVLVEKGDPGSQALAGKSTLNRLELTKETASRKERYKKIVLDHGAVDRLLVEVFLEAHREAPKEIILDLDATDDPLHGKQEGRFFHGYYGHYCYLPLYIFCGEFLLCARLRSSNIDAATGSVEELQRIVAQIRSAWPQVRIVVRGDSGFCREELMAWCEAEGVDYLLGLAKNERLKAEIAKEMGEAKAQYQGTGRAARLFKEFVYQQRIERMTSATCSMGVEYPAFGGIAGGLYSLRARLAQRDGDVAAGPAGHSCRWGLVVLEEDAQVLYGALGVLAALRDIAAERLGPSLE